MQKDEGMVFVFLIILALVLTLPNLGDRTITGDEAYTVLQAKTVLEHGYPYAFYKNFELLPKATHYLGDSPLFNWTPWIESYIAAVMLGLFGMNEFFIRLPFTIIGMCTILLFYFLVKKLTSDSFVIILSTLLLMTSVTFALHIRQARWYSLSAFFALATWYSYIIWLKEEKSVWWLTASAALLFHSQMFTFFAVIFSLVVHYAFFELKKTGMISTLNALWKPTVTLFLVTFPWFLLTGQLVKAGGLASPLKFLLNISIYGYYTLVLLVPITIFVPVIVNIIKNKKIKIIGSDGRTELPFVLTIICASFLFLSVKGDLLPAVRYLVFLIPFLCFLNALTIQWFWERSKLIGSVLIGLMFIGNYLFIVPILPFQSVLENISIDKSADQFLKNSLAPHVYFLDYIYEITHDIDTVDEEIIKVIRKQGKKDDYFITTHFPHTILVYTDMLVGVPDLRSESYYRRMKTSPVNITPNWIIPRGFVLEQQEIEEFLNEANERYDLSTYNKIVIPINDSERWASAPDPINHQFRTREGELVIYHKP